MSSITKAEIDGIRGEIKEINNEIKELEMENYFISKRIRKYE